MSIPRCTAIRFKRKLWGRCNRPLTNLEGAVLPDKGKFLCQQCNEEQSAAAARLTHDAMKEMDERIKDKKRRTALVNARKEAVA